MAPRHRRLLGVLAAVVAAAVTTLSATSSATATPTATGSAARAVAAKPAATKPAATVQSFANIVPAPVSAVPAAGVSFTLGSAATITGDAPGIAGYLAGILRRSTGYPLPVGTGTGPTVGGIALLLTGAPASVGQQGYQLDVTATGVTVRALTPAGLFAGVQSLLEILPPSAESGSVQSGPWTVPGGRVTDEPRYAYRGAMLDVARHFFTVAQVEHYIDQMARYKIDYLHLHLGDDQGWRIAINGWPRLTTYGGSTEVGGGPGGYYTQADYQAIVAYAQQRYITVVPEIDMPGHTNAALASYPQLTCDGVAPPLYTGTDVGFSSLCVGSPTTYTFLDDVIGQLAALTPGPYLHIGGDEAQSTSAADYATFVNKVQAIVAAHGKTAIGWHDIVNATPLPSTIAQFWDTATSNKAVAAAAQKGTKLIMSPANHAYLDMKYTSSTPLGQDWAGLTDVKKAYGWDPGAYLSGVPASAVLGVEAPLWTETIVTGADIEYMAFPRLAAIAELGWSPESTHNWTAFRTRLAAQGPRWKAAGISYYHSTQVAWPAGS
jgi:hexosaminidase